MAGDSVMLRVVRSASVSPTDGHRPASARHPPQRTASADGHRPLPGPLQKRWMPLHQKSSCHMNKSISSKCISFSISFTDLWSACFVLETVFFKSL